MSDFVLLSHPRTGSNLVSRGLEQHIAVEMAGEIFDGLHDAVGAGLPTGVQPYRHGMNAGEYLTRNIFPPIRGTPAAARGFKLFYEHARSDPQAKTLWPRLIGDRRIRLIHLVRPNLFDCQVSLEVALRSGEWFREPKTRRIPSPVAPFTISPWSAQEYFGKITMRQVWVAKTFAHHPLLTIDYDALCADFTGTMGQIFEFLGVAPMALQPSLMRQAKLPPAQQILNYDELAREFRHSLFERFFTDRAAT